LATTRNIEVPALLTPTAIGVATAARRRCRPMHRVAAADPRRALSARCTSSLDVRRQAAPAVRITIERSESGAISVPLLCAGVLLAGFGFGIYYVMPLSLLSFNLALLLNLFVLLLVGMLLGMVLLSLNVSYLLERAVLFAFFFWDADAVDRGGGQEHGRAPAAQPQDRRALLALARLHRLHLDRLQHADRRVRHAGRAGVRQRLCASPRSSSDADDALHAQSAPPALPRLRAQRATRAVKSFTYSTHSLRNRRAAGSTSVRFGPVGNAELGHRRPLRRAAALLRRHRPPLLLAGTPPPPTRSTATSSTPSTATARC
jgi:hypothetical protein